MAIAGDGLLGHVIFKANGREDWIPRSRPDSYRGPGSYRNLSVWARMRAARIIMGMN